MTRRQAFQRDSARQAEFDERHRAEVDRHAEEEEASRPAIAAPETAVCPLCGESIRIGEDHVHHPGVTDG